MLYMTTVLTSRQSVPRPVWNPAHALCWRITSPPGSYAVRHWVIIYLSTLVYHSSGTPAGHLERPWPAYVGLVMSANWMTG